MNTDRLKFRAFYKGTIYQVHNTLDEFSILEMMDDDGDWALDNNGDNQIPLSEVKLMQYTGLKDKHEKDIYEGDIVRFWYLTSTNDWKSKELVVKFSEVDGWLLECKNQRMLLLGFSLKSSSLSIEVVGNIHTNPELLEDKK